jgi:hypothetical protein
VTAAAAPPTATGDRPGGRGRALLAITIVVAVILAIVLLALIAPSRRNDGPPLDPTSTAAQGTKAAVELADRLGADARVTSELPGEDTDIAVMFEDLTSGDATTDVLAWVGDGHTLVVADPFSELTPEAHDRNDDLFADSQSVDHGDCDALEPGGLTELRTLESFGPVARFDVPAGGTSCFADAEGAAVVVVQPVGGGRVISVGTPWVFTNEALDQADNAGLFAALAVPQRGTRLAVLTAGVDGSGLQPPEDSGSLTLPTGVVLGLLQLLVAFVVYCLYRSRRLGRPVPEDPPVVIAGSELTRAVGGLLEHSGARDRAAASLRRSGRRRLATAFGLPAGAEPETVVATVATRTSIDRGRLDAALIDAPVGDDAALADLSRELDDLVELARGRPGPSPAPAASPAGPIPPSPPDSPTASPGGPP